jgi:23S rRNA (guanosine2251-2'-O)-methyltransferase
MPRIVYGQNPVRELLAARAREVSVVYLAAGDTGPALKQLRDMCAQRRVSYEERERDELDALAGEGAKHQGAVAVTGEYAFLELEELLDDRIPAGEPALLVVLDSVQDPHNFGAIIRSAHVLGAHGVIVAKDRAAPVSSATVKASAGATEHMPIARVTNLVRAIETLKERNIWSVAAVARPASHPAPAPSTVDLTGPTALVVGAEGKGLRPLVERTCDLHVQIPMSGRVASLNVSVATGILLYEAARQRIVRSKR